ncbi:hypothetical protein AMECASPLE_013183 [Ameca splendens]|uniref:Secreted protein n=1 Tax=Ameca splendens TaxID=208324 RepID=A0ABV0XED5_9TELE
MHCSYFTSSLAALGTLARHAITLQANRSKVQINPVKTCSCNRARVWFSGLFQGLGWVHTGMIRPWHGTKLWCKSTVSLKSGQQDPPGNTSCTMTYLMVQGENGF